ncbi:hypothetical protein MKK69_13810 [Methylobacterium sp. J-026]|uniref:hypothetical protein n=1 Tax=Methylobacterium sp. J-026 TaxID=2836624 RepID=UPI001FB9B77F|nr:hypothetical protein [Methylobacterium sp. J-026]MCJ2135120.1 hypothetical protein [Methylobacterium sp. J-026]
MIGVVLIFYVLPFVVMAAMPGWRSLAVATVIGVALVGVPWFVQQRHLGEGNGLAEGMAVAMLWLMASSLTAAVAGRSLTLLVRRPSRRWRALGILSVAFLAAPALYFGYDYYRAWERRPPSNECAARRSFAIRFGDIVLHVPKTPVTMVQAGNEIFSLARPGAVRRLCAAVNYLPGDFQAQTVTLFVVKIVNERLRPEITAWLAEGCRDAADVIRRLTCSADAAPEIEQITIYGYADFPQRTASVGVAPTYEFFQRQKAAGKYPLNTATQRGAATVYSGGTWVMDDERSVVQCHPRASKDFDCVVDIRLSDGLNAKTLFTVRGDDVEGAFKRVRSTILDLYTEWRSAP